MANQVYVSPKERVCNMTRRERTEMYYRQKWRLPMDIPFCINCEHFYQHYIKGGPPVFTIDMVPLDCGHCAFPRTKECKAYDTCERFRNKHTNENRKHLIK